MFVIAAAFASLPASLPQRCERPPHWLPQSILGKVGCGVVSATYPQLQCNIGQLFRPAAGSHAAPILGAVPRSLTAIVLTVRQPLTPERHQYLGCDKAASSEVIQTVAHWTKRRLVVLAIDGDGAGGVLDGRCGLGERHDRPTPQQPDQS